MLRGRDSSELEIDLAKVERRLQSLNADGALSPQECELRSLYYTHLRNRLRLLLRSRMPAANENGHLVNTGSSVSQLSSTEADQGQASSLTKVKPSDESWKVITPTVLIHAVIHIRKDFEELSYRQRSYFEKRCFNNLHPLVVGLTEPAVFRSHFHACVEKLCEMVPDAFSRFLDLSLNQNGLIGDAPIEWASLQVTELIEREDRLVDPWIKSACDGPSNVLPTITEEFWDRVVFRADWRAPKWLYMQPNGNALYDVSTAWERMDEAETRKALKAFRESRWILRLESTLEGLVGTAHEALSKRKSSSGSSAPQRSLEHKKRADSKPLMSSYRSDIKRAILLQITRDPNATDAEICRGLDADGAVELPQDWQNRSGDRGFFDAYSDPRTRHKVEVSISKVRRDLRKQGLMD